MKIKLLVCLVLLAAWPAHGAEQSFDLNFAKGEAHTLKVGDATAIYLDEGSGTPIVLFHPGNDYRNWQHQIPELAKTHRVIALSFRIDESAFDPAATGQNVTGAFTGF